MELLRAAPPGSRVADLRRSLARWEPQRNGVEIEDLHELAERHGLELRTEWSSRLPGHYDAIVTRHSAPTAARPTAVRDTHEVRPGDAPDLYANQPALARRRRDLVPRLRELLKERVPQYMVPSAFIVLDGLPLTPNGKVDCEALPVPDAERPVVRGGFVAPRTATERAVAERCAALLGVERVGAEDNFFELGGHSLLATQFVFRLREDLGTDLPLRALFESPDGGNRGRHRRLGAGRRRCGRAARSGAARR